MRNPDIEPTTARVAPAQPIIREGAVSDASPATLDQAQWIAFCQQLSKEALHGSGLSHDVFTGRYSEGIDRAIEKLPTHHRLRALRLAKLSGHYSSPEARAEALRWNAENGCCSHGITLGYCPAGCDVPDDYEGNSDDCPHYEFESDRDAQRGSFDEHTAPLTSSPVASRSAGDFQNSHTQREGSVVRPQATPQKRPVTWGTYLRLIALVPIALISLIPLVGLVYELF